MKKLWTKYRRFLGPAFVVFEAFMHVYLLIYLTFNWTNLLIWGFTAFELSMFIYLLFDKSGKEPHGHFNAHKLCETCPYEETGDTMKMEIRFSETEGRSLVATELIRQGETICELPTKTQQEPDMYSLEVVPGIHLDCYAHPIGATNHSCKPNAAVRNFRLVAWECIKPGEEITIDYRKTEQHLSNSFVCKCCGEKMEW